ncbi:hypothetical protein GALL_243620 [mine drainage metagenome]|uniref:Periplasmic heavy metal sensor n=1 Tax=mine drainage metagenome TaxID=410659 RepID=A0A1J5RD16_9ZZZZ
MSGRRFCSGPLLLALSLGLNLFLAGWLISGALLGHPQTITLPEPPPEVIIADVARALPPADADLLRRNFASRQPAIDQARQTYVAALDHLARVITARPFDAAAFHQAADAMHAAHQSERTLFRATFSQTIPQMSDAGRAAFVSNHFGHPDDHP